MSQKIILITQFFYPSQSATAQLMTDLVEGLARYGHKIQVVTATKSQGNQLLSLDSIQVHRTRLWSQSYTSLWSKFFSSSLFLVSSITHLLLKTAKSVPLLIVSNPPYAGLIGLVLHTLQARKYFFLLQDIFPESAVCAGILKRDSLIFYLISKLTYWIISQSAKTIVLTSAMKDFLENKYPKLVGKFIVIENWGMNGVEPCEKEDNNFAIQYGLDKKFTVMYSGNMGRLHDMRSILDAAYILKEEGIQWVLIGEGAKLNWVTRYCQEKELKNVILLKSQPKSLLPLTLTACDISLVSLIDGAESIVAPSKLYSILAAGRCVVSISSSGSYLEKLLVKNKCGVNSDPDTPERLAQLIKELSLDFEQVKQMGQTAHKLYIESYRLDKQVKLYDKLIRREFY